VVHDGSRRDLNGGGEFRGLISSLDLVLLCREAAGSARGDRGRLIVVVVDIVPRLDSLGATEPKSVERLRSCSGLFDWPIADIQLEILVEKR
jgi:hypothetical protein